MNIESEFKNFLNGLDRTPSPGNSLVMKLPKKDYLPLIEKVLQRDANPNVFSNIIYLLINTKNEISDAIINDLFEDIVSPSFPNEKLYILDSLCAYITAFNKKQYCGALKKILTKYGTKKWLVDNTSAFLLNPLFAVKVLGCINCYTNVKKIVEYGTNINGRVFWAAKEALKELEQEK